MRRRHAENAEVRAGLDCGIARPHLQRADVELTGLAGQLGAKIDRLRKPVGEADSPAEKRPHRIADLAREVEVVRALEEEIALLLEEQRKLRQVHLRSSTSVSAKSG